MACSIHKLGIFCHCFARLLAQNELENYILQPIWLYFFSKSVGAQRFTSGGLKRNTNSGVCLRILNNYCYILYSGSIRKSCKKGVVKADTFSCALISVTKPMYNNRIILSKKNKYKEYLQHPINSCMNLFYKILSTLITLLEK